MKQLDHLATVIDRAAVEASPIQQLSATADFKLQEAYEIQRLSIDKRLTRGETLVGYKLGFTSREKMEQMGVHEVIWGRLTDSMRLSNGGKLSLKNNIHPRIEPEIAFRISKEIKGVLSIDQAQASIDAIAGALEIIDSRYENFKFSLADVVADNCSSSHFVTGEWLRPDTPIQDLDMTLNINGEVRKKGNSNAILGNPLESVVELSKMAAKYRQTIAAGAIILAGAATPAESLQPGDTVHASIQNFGDIHLTVK